MKGTPRFAVYIIDKILKTYWQTFKPKTYGVKALILHPSDPDVCVLIRQSYGDQERWGLPGGGYRPRKESPESAIRRECREELGLMFEPAVDVLENLVTTAEGKRDHLTLFRVTAQSTRLRPNPEVAEALWTPLDYSGLPAGTRISRFADIAISAHREAGAAPGQGPDA
ncbi:NUDIX hydrolase [Winogradskya humida]|uniref:NUDIX hydrolase n=1 Tax=Winogradskya humida TaxID=113566 RepID=A0ABQ4A647_9ACTN|nr:NUDIX domain-containing protein [Actinoplanes humidus]GIE26336.1 NUDIX hydrolase [Actinoplanes humidus]